MSIYIGKQATITDADYKLSQHKYAQGVFPPKSDGVECPYCKWGFAPSVIKQHMREKHGDMS